MSSTSRAIVIRDSALGGVCTHTPDAPNHLCGRVYQITEVRKLP
jgi:hypothetical protein